MKGPHHPPVTVTTPLFTDNNGCTSVNKIKEFASFQGTVRQSRTARWLNGHFEVTLVMQAPPPGACSAGAASGDASGTASGTATGAGLGDAPDAGHDAAPGTAGVAHEPSASPGVASGSASGAALGAGPGDGPGVVHVASSVSAPSPSGDSLRAARKKRALSAVEVSAGISVGVGGCGGVIA